MGIWKTLRVSHIPTPPATTTNYFLTRRYTNIPLGTKDRSDHPRAYHFFQSSQRQREHGAADRGASGREAVRLPAGALTPRLRTPRGPLPEGSILGSQPGSWMRRSRIRAVVWKAS